MTKNFPRPLLSGSRDDCPPAWVVRGCSHSDEKTRVPVQLLSAPAPGKPTLPGRLCRPLSSPASLRSSLPASAAASATTALAAAAKTAALTAAAKAVLLTVAAGGGSSSETFHVCLWLWQRVPDPGSTCAPLWRLCV
jgi:hypothetical protein